MTRTKHAKALEQMHGSLIDALRSREQEIFLYLAILGPALGGFAWLVYEAGTGKTLSAALFSFGTLSALLVLLLGAGYSITLGYNYRYVLLELAKIERVLGIRDAMLVGWPKKREDFYKRFCKPPEIIQVFWIAFLVGIIYVTVVATAYLACRKQHNYCWGAFTFLAGIVCFCIGLLSSKHYGCRLTNLAKMEPEAWAARFEDETS
jgi:cytochrome bd-type quinol oxidase subunit 2